MILAAGAAAAAMTLTACNRDNKTTTTQHSMSGATSSRTYGTNESGSMRNTSDAAFLQQAAMGGRAEVELSQMALRQSSRQDVRDLAQHMITDHTAANQQVQQLADARGITLPSQPDTQHRQLSEQLNNANGPSFDQLYLQTMLQDHRQTISMFERESQSAADPQIRSFATSTLPKLRDHLRMVESLTSGHGMGNMHDMNSMNNNTMQNNPAANEPSGKNEPGAQTNNKPTEHPSTDPGATGNPK
jgi:putative membrane protein